MTPLRTLRRSVGPWFFGSRHSDDVAVYRVACPGYQYSSSLLDLQLQSTGRLGRPSRYGSCKSGI